MIAVIRIRGHVNVNRDIEATMKMLNLTRVNHCTLVKENASYLGMLQKAKDYITHGPIEAEVLTELISKRGMLAGDRPITEGYVKEHTEYESIEEFAQAIVEGRADLHELSGMKPVFRLHPPVRGYRGIKRHYNAGGTLGNRGEAINELIRRMI